MIQTNSINSRGEFSNSFDKFDYMLKTNKLYLACNQIAMGKKFLYWGPNL